jgi:TonB family protein
MDRLASELIRRAARNAPASLSQRLEEEWLADLATRRGQIVRWRLAVGCWWAAHVIAHEHASIGLVPAGSPAGHQLAATYAPREASFPSRRTIALLLIASLHGCLIYLLAVGLVHQTAEVPPSPLSAEMTNETQPHTPPPPPPAVTLVNTHVEVPPPDFTVESAPDADRITVAPNNPHHEGSTQPAPAVEGQPGGPARGFPKTADFYPDASRRLGEKGVASVRVCVDSLGRLTSDPSIAQSSGSARLDGGALTLAKAGSGHYRPTIEDGKAVPSCFAFRIRFDFRD